MDLLGLGSSPPPSVGGATATPASAFLLDVFETMAPPTANGLDANGLSLGAEENCKKYA